MEITWYGHSCFRMVERGIATIVTDPYDESIGYEPLRLKSDILTVSHTAPGHATLDVVKGVTYYITRPGEYEIGGVFITGIATYRMDTETEPRYNIAFRFDFDKFNVCHLGDLDYVPDQSQIEALGPIDVLLIPVGGGGALTSSQAAEVVSLIEPGIVVPMHYQTPACTLDLEPLEKFLKEMGVSGTVEETNALTVRSSGADEQTRVVVLKYEH